MPYGTTHEQLVFVDNGGHAYAVEEATPGHPGFDTAWSDSQAVLPDRRGSLDIWWTRFEFIMSTIKLDPDGTPVSVVLQWIGDWDVSLNRKELLDALHGLGYRIHMQLKGPNTGAAQWIVRPPGPAGARRPSLRPTEP